MKYYIVPKAELIDEIESTSCEEALLQFVDGMDMNMNAYFEALSEEDYAKYKENIISKHRAQHVTNFMYNELLSFDMKEASDDVVRDLAETAYDIYCEGNGQTEYECIEEAYNNWYEENGFDDDYEEEEIVPTKEEKKEWKEYLYNSCMFLATERPEFRPRKRDSLQELLSSFLGWASTYNDGYFSERDDADTDRYCAWLVQEYEKGFY